jgi:hypothetical protein
MNAMIERAGRMQSGIEGEILYRCRNAPRHVKENIDARRAARGLQPLWARATRGRAARASVRRLKAFLAVARLRAS